MSVPDRAREAVYLTAAQTLARYSRKNVVWLHRLLKSDPTFPRPIYICERRFWSIAELEAWDKTKARTAPLPMPETADIAKARAAAMAKRKAKAAAAAA